VLTADGKFRIARLAQRRVESTEAILLATAKTDAIKDSGISGGWRVNENQGDFRFVREWSEWVSQKVWRSGREPSTTVKKERTSSSIGPSVGPPACRDILLRGKMRRTNL
jgi:hypothetical protein